MSQRRLGCSEMTGIQGLREFSPGGQIRLVEADEPAARAAPGTVGVSSEEAVSTGWVQAAVGYRHLYYARMGGGIQQSLHRQTEREREAWSPRHSVTPASYAHHSQPREPLTSSAPHPFDSHSSGLLKLPILLGQGRKSWLGAKLILRPTHPMAVQEQVLHRLAVREDLQLLNDVHPGAQGHCLVQAAITWEHGHHSGPGGAQCPGSTNHT